MPKRQGQNLTLQLVVVFLSYDRNANTARFDDISLKIEPAQLYDYDENGNLVSNYNSDGNETLLEYAENMVDIAEYTNILGEKYEYTYKTVGGVDTHLVQTVSKTDAENNTLTLTYDYDAYGNTTGSTLTSSESTYKVTSSASYTDSGNRLSAVTDASGSTVSYTYNGYGLASSVTDANGNRMGTQYDSRRRVTAVYLDADKDGTIDAAETAVHYTYDGSGRLETIETDGTEYTLVYDVHGNVTSIKAGDYTLVTNTYGANNGALLTSETGNGYETEYEYDSLGRVKGIKKNGVLKYRVTYNGDGAAFRVEDLAVGHITEYEYDGAGRLVRASKMSSGGTALLTVENKYDTYGRAVGSTYVLPGKTLSYELEYVPGSSQVEKLTLPGGEEVTYNYDAFERLSNISLPASMVDYSYESDSATGKTSNRVSSYGIWAHYPESGMYSYQYSLGYTYDANGNITEIEKGSAPQSTYEYDSKGQLIREDDHAIRDKTYVYTYDKSGNRTATYEFPNEGAPAGHWLALYPYAGELLAEYEYTNSSWGDLLTNYDGTAITYDSSGNPKNWKDVSHLQWSGDRLMRANFYLMDSTVDFYYNSDGIRIKKDDWREEISHIDHLYTLDGSRIISEQCLAKNGSNEVTDSYTLYYIYDTAGSVIGFEYNGTKYWYDKNLQGDITAIRNASGTLVAQYEYDAWGKHIRITDGSGNDVSDNPNHIANINPFRYRGYYFDVETGWYYLNARYYDPNVGRFISPDAILGANGGLQGYNLFAYCNNNPVMYIDPNGNLYLPNAQFNAIPVCPENIMSQIKNANLNATTKKYSGSYYVGNYQVHTFNDLKLYNSSFFGFSESVEFHGTIADYYFEMSDNQAMYQKYNNRYEMLNNLSKLLDVSNGGGLLVNVPSFPNASYILTLLGAVQVGVNALRDAALEKAEFYKNKPNEYELKFVNVRHYLASVNIFKETNY